MKHHIKQTAMRGFLRFKNWWFWGAPTFWLDVILALGLISTGVTFWIDGDVLVQQHHIYHKFAELPIWALVLFPTWSGVWLLFELNKSDMAIGFARLWASFIWTLCFIAYWQAYPPLNIDILWSLMLAFFGFLASFQQIYASNRREKCKELLARGKVGDECNKLF